MGHLGPWAPLPSAEGGSHSMVTPRVDRDFTSKLVGIEGLGRCCGENSPADASDASGDLGFHLTFI